MKITNPWIGYFDRSYEQIKTGLLTKLGGNVPEITDHTETDPWVKQLSIWGGLVEMLGYYVDSNAREAFLVTALEFASAVKKAREFDYRVKGAVPASCVLRFTSSVPATGAISIPIGTRVQTATGLIFSTTSAGVIGLGQTFVDVDAKQWDAVTNVALGNSNGSVDQQYELEEDVADGSVAITVNVTSYSGQDTFAFSFATDTHFVAGLGETTKMTVKFGDGVNGKIPPSGQAIAASYKLTDGEDGNVGAGVITTVVSTIVVPGSEIISVNNALGATGGASYENLPKLQKRIPLSIRTKYRAVTDQDFIDIAELFAGVEKAGVQFNCDVDKYVHVFITPEGGGEASQPLITDVLAFINKRKIITTKIKVEGAGLINFIIQANVVTLPGYSNAAVKNTVEQNILLFFDSQNQKIQGRVAKGDIIEVMEESDGVDYSELTLIIAIPHARNLTTVANVLNWTRALQVGSTVTTKWLLRFLSVSQYELFRGTDFVGTFNVNVLVSQTEIVFTIVGNHQAGDNYEFYTYPYNQSVFLSEPSIPATQIGLLTINVSGGV